MALPASVTLQTERLMLRPFCDNDYEAVHAYASDPEVTRYTSFGPNTPEETTNFLRFSQESAKHDPRLSYSFAIVLRESGRLIGGAGVRLEERDRRIAEIGYVLHRNHWGRGYAAEAGMAMIDFGFSKLGLHRVYACYHPDNHGSKRVMEKLGMQFEGVLRHSVFLKGSWWDFGQCAILEDEWSAKGTTRLL